MAQQRSTTRRGATHEGEATSATVKALAPERIAAVQAAARALPPAEVTRAPGALRVRLTRMQRATQTALAKAGALVAVPMAPDAPLTREELQRTADLVAVLSLTNAEVGAAAAQPADAAVLREEKAGRAHQAVVLRGIRHVFRGDRAVRQWVLKVGRGVGLADLVSDADEMQAFWTRHEEALSVLTRGERESLKKLVTIAEALRPRVQATNEATGVRRLRDAIYTLASRGIARIRAAAAYAFEPGDPVLATFRTTPPRRKKKATAAKG
jgi:hypothetical protein